MLARPLAVTYHRLSPFSHSMHLASEYRRHRQETYYNLHWKKTNLEGLLNPAEERALLKNSHDHHLLPQMPAVVGGYDGP